MASDTGSSSVLIVGTATAALLSFALLLPALQMRDAGLEIVGATRPSSMTIFSKQFAPQRPAG